MSDKGRVYLRQDSEWNDGSDCNPLGAPGIVIGWDFNDTELCVRVMWSNGYTNWYHPKDLFQEEQV